MLLNWTTAGYAGSKACGKNVRPGGHELTHSRKSPQLWDIYGENQA